MLLFPGIDLHAESSGDQLHGHDGSLRCREAHHPRLSVALSSSSTSATKSCCGSGEWEVGKPAAAVSSLAGMVSFQMLGMVSAVVSVGLVAKSTSRT